MQFTLKGPMPVFKVFLLKACLWASAFVSESKLVLPYYLECLTFCRKISLLSDGLSMTGSLAPFEEQADLAEFQSCCPCRKNEQTSEPPDFV